MGLEIGLSCKCIWSHFITDVLNHFNSKDVLEKARKRKWQCNCCLLLLNLTCYLQTPPPLNVYSQSYFQREFMAKPIVLTMKKGKCTLLIFWGSREQGNIDVRTIDSSLIYYFHSRHLPRIISNTSQTSDEAFVIKFCK